MLSVVVPVYNGTQDLQQCLAALAASHYDDFVQIPFWPGARRSPPVSISLFHLRPAGCARWGCTAGLVPGRSRKTSDEYA